MTIDQQSPTRTAYRAHLLVLIAGFLGCAVAILTAALTPTTQYELSVYDATPISFWVGLVGAALATLIVIVRGQANRYRLAIGLGTMTMVTLLGLPLFRGYYFYGTGDPFTHLGWARRLAAAAITPMDLIYPGVHSLAVFFHTLSGMPVRQGLLVANVVFPLVFVGAIGLTVRAILPARPHAGAVGVLSAFLLLPINHISTHLKTHPFSQATMFSALVVFVLWLYLTRTDADRRLPVVSASGFALALVASASTLYHPQVAADLLVLFVVLTGLFVLARSRLHARRGVTVPSLLGPTVVFALAYASWSLRASWFYGGVQRVFDGLMALAYGQAPVGQNIASQSTSLLAVGSSPFELYLKLFGPATVFLVLAGLYLGSLVVNVIKANPIERYVSTPILTVGVGIALGFFGVYFAGSIAEEYFRHLGLMMLFVTLLGSLGLARVAEPVFRAAHKSPIDQGDALTPAALSDGGNPRKYSTVAQVGFVSILLVLFSLVGAVAHESPYIYHANEQVTEAEFTAYEWVFEHTGDSQVVSGIRAGPERFQDAVLGPALASQPTPALEARELMTLQQSLPDGGVLVISDRAIQRETIAYRGLRYERSHFESVARQPGVDRIYANGETVVYGVS